VSTVSNSIDSRESKGSGFSEKILHSKTESADPDDGYRYPPDRFPDYAYKGVTYVLLLVDEYASSSRTADLAWLVCRESHVIG